MRVQLNWKELKRVVESIQEQTKGLFVERVIVPSRPLFRDRFLKGEWAIELKSRTYSGTLLFSLRSQNVYLTWQEGKGSASSIDATRSAFGLSLAKHLRGCRLQGIETVPRERVVILKFGAEKPTLALILVLIPNSPNGFLVSLEDPRGWLVLAQSRGDVLEFYTPPDGSKAPEDPPLRDEAGRFQDYVEKELEVEAFSQRSAFAEKTLRQQIKIASDKSKQFQVSVDKSQKEPDWQHFADLLKGSLGAPAEIRGDFRRVTDYATGEIVEIPFDPKLSETDQLKKFYDLSKRKQRRLKESLQRMEEYSAEVQKLEKLITLKPTPGDWTALENWERVAGIPVGAGEVKKQTSRWKGKSFISKDGFAIWLGRSRDENQELLKAARGNDLWMHVRGKPGAHAIVVLPPGKSPPLETLLDAAALVVQYSGGSSWGKTEVDYTFRKFVKRIKGSTEVSYTGNKTLIVDQDPARLKRLIL